MAQREYDDDDTIGFSWENGIRHGTSNTITPSVARTCGIDARCDSVVFFPALNLIVVDPYDIGESVNGRHLMKECSNPNTSACITLV